MRRKVRSETRLDGGPAPAWASYMVDLASLATPAAPAQWFTCRTDAERFARAIAKRLPREISSNGCVAWWVLVYALPPRRRPGVDGCLLNGHCYLSLDPGAAIVKHHPIITGYGVPAAA